MPAMSGSSSPGRRGVFARCTLAFARRSSLCFRFSWRARSLLRFSSVGLVRVAIRASFGSSRPLTRDFRHGLLTQAYSKTMGGVLSLAGTVVPTGTSCRAQVVHTVQDDAQQDDAAQQNGSVTHGASRADPGPHVCGVGRRTVTRSPSSAPPCV